LRTRREIIQHVKISRTAPNVQVIEVRCKRQRVHIYLNHMVAGI